MIEIGINFLMWNYKQNMSYITERNVPLQNNIYYLI